MEPFENYRVEEFVFVERKAVIIYPNCEPIGKIVLKTEYLGAFPSFDYAMLDRGYYLIHIFHQTRWASDEETDIMADFVRFCAEKLNASKRCILEGMSCGGLQATRLAEEYPELCAVMYLDAPVLNILSMVGLGESTCEANITFWREIVATFGVNKSTIVNFRKSAIDKMEPLIENNIPVIMLYGNADDVVLYEENGRVLENFYKEKGGIIKVISRSMCGHHPHCIDDPTVIVEFVEKYYEKQ